MNLEGFRQYCLSLKGVTEEFPFDNETLVFKVMGKMFALADVTLFVSINLKADPEKAIELRERYEGIQPGYHMNKKHWNTVVTDGSITERLLIELINDSYNLVVAGLPKAVREALIADAPAKKPAKAVLQKKGLAKAKAKPSTRVKAPGKRQANS